MEAYIGKTLGAYVARAGEPRLSLKQKRIDTWTSLAVDAAVEVQAKHSTYPAAFVLHVHQVPIDTALRVLLRPRQRREV